MEELKAIRKLLEQLRDDTARCPSTMDLYAVAAFDLVLRMIDQMLGKTLDS